MGLRGTSQKPAFLLTLIPAHTTHNVLDTDTHNAMVLLSKIVLTSHRVRAAWVRPLHVSSIAAIAKSPPGHDLRFFQGNVGTLYHEHRFRDQAARSGQHIARGKQKSSSLPYNAALHSADETNDRAGYSRDLEGMAFSERVCSATSLGRKGEARLSDGEGKGVREDSAPSDFLTSLRRALGL